jgi:hypothetical protein
MSTNDGAIRGFRSMITGERGKHAICDLFLSWGWIPRPLDGSLDQGIDVIVELGNDGIGSGVHFAVQSKATDGRAKIASDGIGLPLKSRNVDYLLSQRLPVFLVFADIAGEAIYWTDAKASLKKTPRKRNGSAYLKIPLQNRIDSSCGREGARALFLRALQRANSSLTLPEQQRAVGAMEMELNELDPRIQVKVSVGSEQARYELRLLQEVNFQSTMQFKSVDEAEKLREALDYGLSTSVAVDSFAMSGSPLVDHLMEGMTAGLFTVEPAPGETVTVYIGAPPSTPEGKILHALPLKGAVHRGFKGGNVIASCDEHPITVEIRVFSDQGSAEVSLGTDVTAWVGKSLSPMSALPEAARTLKEIVAANRFAFGIKSRRFLPSMVSVLTAETAQILQAAAAVLARLDDLRELAIRYGKDVAIEKAERYHRTEPEWWDVARRIIDGEVVSVASRTLTLTGEFAPEAESLLSKGTEGYFVISNAPLVITACGEEICRIPVDVLAQNFSAKWPATFENNAEVKLSPGDGSALRLRRHSPTAFDPNSL